MIRTRDPIGMPTFFPQGDLLAVAIEEPPALAFVHVPSGTERLRLGVESPVRDMRCSANGQVLLTTDQDGVVQAWKLDRP